MLPDPRGTRKYVGEKFPLPHGGEEDVGGERAEDGEPLWEDVSGPGAHHPSPGGAG